MQLLVDTPARLHLGLIDLNGKLGRLYGSLGVAVDRPRLVLQAERLPSAPGRPDLDVTGQEAERVAAYARRFLAAYPIAGAFRLSLQSAIPSHVGLGSGTQLALAVGAALARLGDLELGAPAIARALGRGAHSGIGIATFETGGLVVDGGHTLCGEEDGTPPVLFRHPFPEDWRFVVAIPRAPAGLNGAAERQAFQTLPSAPASFVEKICRLLVMQLLPALIEHDLAPFGQALTGIQQLVGDSFAAVQGGRFANTVSGDLVAHWLRVGAAGAGQSSWGPAVYALAGDEPEAGRLAEAARTFLHAGDEGDVFVTQGANRGAQITTLIGNLDYDSPTPSSRFVPPT
jgi:beta-RFAP synthase